MSKIVFGMMQSLDGYVAGVNGEMEPPGVALFRYWIDYVRDLAGSLYGRRMYEAMRYWDEDQPDCDASERSAQPLRERGPKLGGETTCGVGCVPP